MAYYVGLDVSVKTTSVCIVDAAGKIVKERSVATEPELIAAWLGKSGLTFERIGHEAGPMSSWLHEGLSKLDLPVHQCRFYRFAARRQDQDQHGRQGRMAGQRLCRAALAKREI